MGKKKNNKRNRLLYVIIVLLIILLYKRLKLNTSSTIPIPKYILYRDDVYIPIDVQIIRNHFSRDPNYKNYKVCLVGEKESLAKDLKETIALAPTSAQAQALDKDLKENGEIFIHLDNDSLKSLNLPSNVIDSIEGVNALVSNPENYFNTTPVGTHTVGLVPKNRIKDLNYLGYGLEGIFTLKIYASDVGKYNDHCDAINCYYSVWGDRNGGQCETSYPTSSDAVKQHYQNLYTYCDQDATNSCNRNCEGFYVSCSNPEAVYPDDCKWTEKCYCVGQSSGSDSSGCNPTSACNDCENCCDGGGSTSACT
tara:strand:+ start:857 stop:1783 length:927 start_codon:yes stop_codon:yes gene_type:complete